MNKPASEAGRTPAKGKPAPARKAATKSAARYVVALPTGETVTLADKPSADRLALFLARLPAKPPQKGTK